MLALLFWLPIGDLSWPRWREPAAARDAPRPGVEPRRLDPQPATPAEIAAPAVEHGEEMRIPEQGLDFLEGRWRSKTALVDSLSGQPLVVTLTFYKDGGGQAHVRQEDGTECEGAARARRTEGGGLAIEGGSARCNNGTAFVPFHMECEAAPDRRAQCHGVNGDDGSTYEVTIRRE